MNSIRICSRFAVLAALVAVQVSAQEPFDTRSAQDLNMTTGPAVGERIPYFEALDQNGVRRTFDDIKGPNGALILFHRSADW